MKMEVWPWEWCPSPENNSAGETPLRGSFGGGRVITFKLYSPVKELIYLCSSLTKKTYGIYIYIPEFSFGYTKTINEKI